MYLAAVCLAFCIFKDFNWKFNWLGITFYFYDSVSFNRRRDAFCWTLKFVAAVLEIMQLSAYSVFAVCS